MQRVAAATSVPLAHADGPDVELTPPIRARRKRNRRDMLLVMMLNCIIDIGLFYLFALAGTTAMTTPLYFGISGMGLLLSLLALSETGFNDRFADHYLTVPQGIGATIIALGGIYLAPEVGFAFCCIVFVIFSFATLRTNEKQAGVLWTLFAAGLAGILLFTNKPIGLPSSSWEERVVTLLFLVTTLGYCVFVSLFSVSIRETLYKRSRQLAEANQRIETMAQFDELTGALNRRFLMQKLDEDLVRAQRAELPYAIALIDLDWFKKINDTFGHPAGDEALRTFAITIFANIRDIDKLGRYGGEEFLLVLPNTSEEAAVNTLNRLREIIAEADWAAISPSMSVTMSAGITAMRLDDTTDTLLARADAALYRAKESGRNRVLAN
jgi:diguanylate cyclase (GGDEF)-like protein